MNSLLTIKRGQKARITHIRAEQEIDQRIANFGITKDSVVCLTRVAPLGDPIAIEVDGSQIVLRKSEASGIQVELI